MGIGIVNDVMSPPLRVFAAQVANDKARRHAALAHEGGKGGGEMLAEAGASLKQELVQRPGSVFLRRERVAEALGAEIVQRGIGKLEVRGAAFLEGRGQVLDGGRETGRNVQGLLPRVIRKGRRRFRVPARSDLIASHTVHRSGRLHQAVGDNQIMLPGVRHHMDGRVERRQPGVAVGIEGDHLACFPFHWRLLRVFGPSFGHGSGGPRPTLPFQSLTVPQHQAPPVTV